MRRIRALLIDEHVLVRAGIRVLLDEIGLVEVVGEASNGVQALDLIGRLRPAVVFLELAISGLTGFEFLKISREKFPKIHIIVLTMLDSSDCAAEAMRSGASGYLPKSAASSELGLAIEQVVGGRKYLSPTIGPEEKVGVDPTGLSVLTPRQVEVLRLIAEGYCTKAIGVELEISVKTVETHRASLMDRLQIYDVASLVRFAVKRGLVSLDEKVPAKRTRIAVVSKKMAVGLALAVGK